MWDHMLPLSHVWVRHFETEEEVTLCQGVKHLSSRDIGKWAGQENSSWRAGPMAPRLSGKQQLGGLALWTSSLKFLSPPLPPLSPAVPSMSRPFSQDLVFHLSLDRCSVTLGMLLHICVSQIPHLRQVDINSTYLRWIFFLIKWVNIHRQNGAIFTFRPGWFSLVPLTVGSNCSLTKWQFTTVCFLGRQLRILKV